MSNPKSKSKSKIPSFLNLSSSSSSPSGTNTNNNLFPFRPFRSSHLAIPTSPLLSPRSPLSPSPQAAPAIPSISSRTARGNNSRSRNNDALGSQSQSQSQSKLQQKRKKNKTKNDSSPFFNNVFDEESDGGRRLSLRSRSTSSSPPCSPLSSPSSSLSSSVYPSPPPSPPPPPPPPPPRPMPWTWQCHLCHRRYPLGVTRRCLDDGHYFCSGVTEVRGTGTRRRGSGSGSEARTKRVKRHRPCQSEFDYDGWKAWGEWRRSILSTMATATSIRESVQNTPAAALAAALTSAASSLPSPRRLAVQLDDAGDIISNIAVDDRNNQVLGVGHGNGSKKNCSRDCDYPSECRWKRQMTVRTPESVSPGFLSDTAAATVSITAVASKTDVNNNNNNNINMDRKISGAEMLLPTVFEEDDSNNDKPGLSMPSADMASKDDFWKSLLASVSRQKSLGVQDDSVDMSDLAADTADDGSRSASV